ncbi:MAG TPA: hypothetical protein VFS43_02905 [Polyangiaceae bacterium]|nr:hypothetical protein [Polyangiaceae bacterium]
MRRPAQAPRRAAALAALAALALGPRAARAQDPNAPALPPTPAMPTTGLELSHRHQTFWQDTKTRPFVAARVDLGYVYFRPLLAAGYGRPYWRWFGVEASPIVSGIGFAGYSGLRAALPRLELRTGARYFLPFRRSFLFPQESYTQLDAESRIGAKSRYWSLEAEAASNIRVGLGDVVLLGTVHHLLEVNEGYHVFDETLRVVAEPPWVWRLRLGYAIPLTNDRLFRIAPVGEVIGVPGRDALIGRGGIVASATFSDFIDVFATFVPVIFSPDRLGLAGADFAQIGIRYRWASGTGEPTAGPGETLSGRTSSRPAAPPPAAAPASGPAPRPGAGAGPEALPTAPVGPRAGPEGGARP